jgi:formylmethanofuran dehydrogenase subunit E
MVTCGACGRVVAERLTVITADGVICDVCAARKR